MEMILFLVLGLICFGSSFYLEKALPECEIFTEGRCQGDEIDMPEEFKKRVFQTPVRGSEKYRSSFQDYSHLQGWTSLTYSPDHRSAIVEIKTIIKDQSANVTYFFDGEKQTKNSRKYDSSYQDVLMTEVRTSDGKKLVLPPVDFIWNAPTVPERNGDFRNGQKGAIVEMFGWSDEDITKECKFLAKAGYLGVKLFPHHEQLMSNQPFNQEINPWYFMYQPVSYRLEGRMGTRNDLRKLIQTCRSLGVRVYHDMVVNHMTGGGNDIQAHRNDNGGFCNYWPGKNSSAKDVSPFFTQCFCFKENENTGLPPTQEFPAVPYQALDFHCERSLKSWGSPLDLNAAWLVGLTDLHTGRTHVQERIADYFVDVLSLGFSGFRIDAFKHISPDDMIQIIKKFKEKMGNELPEDFILWGELLLGGEHDILLCNKDSGYNFGEYFTEGLQKAGLTDDEILKIKLWSSWYPKEPYADCDKVDRRREVITNDDADQQTEGSTSRDMQDKGSVLVIEKDIEKHRQFEIKMFEDPFEVRDNKNDWPIRTILSSYWFDTKSGSHAIPDGKSSCSLCTITCDGCKSVEKTEAFDENSKGYDGFGEGKNGYTRVHRDEHIISAMRKWMEIE